MICKECGSNMRLDDKDYNFTGNYDIYWCCDNCQTSCIEQVRCSQSFKEIWHSENNNDVKDYEIKHEIKEIRCGSCLERFTCSAAHTGIRFPCRHYKKERES